VQGHRRSRGAGALQCRRPSPDPCVPNRRSSVRESSTASQRRARPNCSPPNCSRSMFPNLGSGNSTRTGYISFGLGCIETSRDPVQQCCVRTCEQVQGRANPAPSVGVTEPWSRNAPPPAAMSQKANCVGQRSRAMSFSHLKCAHMLACCKRACVGIGDVTNVMRRLSVISLTRGSRADPRSAADSFFDVVPNSQRQ
jgi:hypothetical protein